eukprot:m.48812 g.48812  ORF g.48812 m.48812 type:complete len:884 (-) comp7416_c0_seq1:127-2778(-)
MKGVFFVVIALVLCHLLPLNVCGFGKSDIHDDSISIVRVNAETTVMFYSENIVRVIATPTKSSMSLPSSLIVTMEATAEVDVEISRVQDTITMETEAVTVQASISTGLVIVMSKRIDAQFQELERSFTRVEDMGNETYKASQSFYAHPDRKLESIVGLGQYQNGIINFNQVPINLMQFNTEAVVPFWMSSTGYGVLHDNLYSHAHWNQPTMQIVFSSSFIAFQNNLTTLVASIPPPEPSNFQEIYLSVKSADVWGVGSTFINLTVGGQECLLWNNFHNLPNEISCVAANFGTNVQGNVDVIFTYDSSSIPNAPQVSFKYAGTANTIDIDIADFISYYVITPITDPTRGNTTFDQLIAGYRSLTGTAPLYSKKVYGFWQCKERYHNQTELMDAAKQFRNRSLPIDQIVQDWHYWGNLGWGPQWDPTIYSDPREMVSVVHALHMDIMVSVWSKFDTSTEFYKTMSGNHEMIPGGNYFDPYNPSAQKTFYGFSQKSMFDIGVDYLWLDATEPEGFPNINQSVFLGSGNKYLNTYSLMVTSAINSNHNKEYDNTRYFSLTRSSFAGQQRTGAALWSGDITADYEVLRRQITASINFAASGMPYWSNDIGGFFRPSNQYTDPSYHDLLVRWFQFGTFVPIYRVHGDESDTEYWNYGSEVESLILATSNLRYRLLPYIYTYGASTTFLHDTMHRLLSFDFNEDNLARNISDQFMFGRDLMVAPVLSLNTTSRPVYFPSASANWTDFFSCDTFPNASLVVVDTPIDHAPVFVRPGTILPLGPFLQYAFEKPSDPLEIRIYPGEDNEFTLYEDDGMTNAYKSNQEFSTITFNWINSQHSLVIQQRLGTFQGMLKTRTFLVIVVENNNGCGLDPSSGTKTIVYNGLRQEVQL